MGMHIALMSYEYPPDTAFGGIGTYTQQVARILSGNGHSVEVFAASGRRGGYEEDSNLRVNFVEGLDRDAFATKAARAFGERHAVRAFDVVESPEFSADGREVLRLYPEVAHVVKMHSPLELLVELNSCRLTASGWFRWQTSRARRLVGGLRRGRKPQFRNKFGRRRPVVSEVERIERDYVKRCDFVVSPSKALLDWSISRWSVNSQNSMVVPNPYVPSSALLDIKARPNDRVVVGFVGRLEHRKGVVDLVDAIPSILEAEPDTRFRFVGEARSHPGTLEPFDVFVGRKLRRRADKVCVVGGCGLDQMPREYSLLDICVFPSIWENFPNVCLEAMSAGKPVVASRAGGMAEMLDGGGGLLISPRSPKELAAAVIQMIRSPELRLAAGEQGRRQVLERYSANAILPLVESSYRRAVLANRHKRCCGF
jgi:glycogen(starch) synthase